ncbi:MAG TPA: DUF1778 domain-containing protein [Candidatus Desulfovibrio intestinipullorum]|uniref:DUF1778 domain-containing protein n=1 Tax=Candidatus Desulfovibrio intestinipullorum TaxID=2838536 RepID=A0A9D1PUY2_9BACT|nr:DUF1778 domain-containing protein [Candidatus Desulfovibrio intestinipullorum]
MTARTEVIALRIPSELKNAIDRAARLRGTNRTAFILDAAAREANNVLAEETTFELGPEQWNRFVELLDAPVQARPALHKLLATPAPWEKRSRLLPH